MKGYGERRAVDGVDVSVEEGEAQAIVGPNGAGKTTLLRMLATLLRPEAGRLEVAGCRLPDEAGRARGLIGYLTHDPLVYLDLTAWQNLELFADLYGVREPRRRIEDVLDEVGLLARAFEPVRAYSHGMAQRLGLARLMLHRPGLLLLDEPHSGLDAPGAALLDRLLGEARGTRAAVLVTHDVERAVAVADRVMVMRAGRVAESVETEGLDPAEFRGRYEALVG